MLYIKDLYSIFYDYHLSIPEEQKLQPTALHLFLLKAGDKNLYENTL